MTWTIEQPKKETNLLDLIIIIHNTKGITHKINEKNCNLHNYLPTNSAHPACTFKSLIVGFIRRYRLVNSTATDYINQIIKFAEKLKK